MVVDGGAEAGEVGDAAADVFKVFVVGFGVGLELDGGGGLAFGNDGGGKVAGDSCK